MALEVMITTPEGLVYQGEARQVTVPAHDGELGILPRHAPLIGELGVGELRVVSSAPGSKGASFFVEGGFVQVLRNQVVVLATRAKGASEIDASSAEAELRSLLEEEVPKGTGTEVREGRSKKIRAARARVKVAGKGKAAD